MCLILFALSVHPDYPLLVAANRDEFYARPTAPAHFWEEPAGLLAGRDERSGGTWMGMRGDRWAAVTNFREPASPPSANLPSRGQLAVEFLRGSLAPLAYLQKLAELGSEYAGYNFLCGQGATVGYQSNRSPQFGLVEPGLHGLSNHLLDTPWPKVVRGCAALEGLSEPDDLLGMLADRGQAPDPQLPETGVGIDQERALSPLFIDIEGRYGTRCSTVLRRDRAGNWLFVERRYVEGGGHQDSRFELTGVFSDGANFP